MRRERRRTTVARTALLVVALVVSLTGIGGTGIAFADERDGGRFVEHDAGARRAAEGEDDAGRPAGADDSREAAGPLRTFRARHPSEAELHDLLVELRREVTLLRSEVEELCRLSRERGVGPGAVVGAETDDPPPGWERTKAGAVFGAYDKNGDMVVSLDEWLAITNGNTSTARREIQTKRFREAGPGHDEKLGPAEFVRWWNNRDGASRRAR